MIKYKSSIQLFDMIKAVIFDLDGVLVDTEYYQWQGWNAVLKQFGIKISRKEYYDYAGKRGDIIDEELRKKYKLNTEKGSIINEKEILLLKWFKEKKLKQMPYAKQAVNFFTKKGLKTAVCTGSPKEEALIKLRKIGLVNTFHKIITGDEVKRGKPFPDVYLLAVKKLGLKKRECIAFEDTQYGLQAAKSAGLTCYAIPSEYAKKQNFSKADKVFKNLRKALEYVNFS